MKNWAVVLFLSSLSFAGNPSIDACLKSWGKHPFGKNYSYRTLQTNVKILGIGGNVLDGQTTKKPELILVNHSVSVMSKQVFEFLNPNGWYCIKGSTSVLGKSQIRVHCKAHLASTIEGAAVLGGSEQGTGGVTVLGRATIEKVGCEDTTNAVAKEEKTEPEKAKETPTPAPTPSN